MGLFWEHGFEGGVRSAISPTPPGSTAAASYAEFGSKDATVQASGAAVHGRSQAGYIAEALQAADRLGRCPTRWCTVPPRPTAGDGRPRGCLLVQGALAAGEESEAVSERALCSSDMDGVEALARRFDEAQAAR